METKSTYQGPPAQKIRTMFSSIAEKYDVGNDVLSLGIHHQWRKQLVKLSQAKVGDSVLDCATGTGDLAIEFKKAVGPSGKVIGTDFCAEMLEFAPAKAAKLNLDIIFEIADVMNLQYSDSTFDFASISFGIRNVENPQQGIRELHRILKSTGKLLVLEFGQPKAPIISNLYRFYSKKILPKIGGWISGKSSAYEYLEKSSGKFPSGNDFIKMLSDSAQWKSIKAYPLQMGIAYIYIAEKT